MYIVLVWSAEANSQLTHPEHVHIHRTARWVNAQLTSIVKKGNLSLVLSSYNHPRLRLPLRRYGNPTLKASWEVFFTLQVHVVFIKWRWRKWQQKQWSESQESLLNWFNTVCITSCYGHVHSSLNVLVMEFYVTLINYNDWFFRCHGLCAFN